jgi:hypothetical protein
MLKRVLCAAGLAGALLVAAPTAAFAHDHGRDGWRHGSDCGGRSWHHHHHHGDHRHGDNWNKGWNHSNDGWNCGGNGWNGNF